MPNILKQLASIKRYYVKGDFNPRSTQQLLDIMGSKGHQGGALGKAGKPSTDKKILEQLAKKDSFYRDILDYRAVGKIRGTYCDGIEARLDSEDRVHPQFIHLPSTMRLSSKNPNLQNVVADKEGEATIAAGFRKCIVASPGCVLIEADFSAIEALLVGWLIKDPVFMRLATLGIHSWHASHILGKPVSLDGSDEEVGKRLKAIKALDRTQYDKSKIVIYGSLYAQSPWGLQKTYPEIFPTQLDAARNQELLFSLCPKLKQWHSDTRQIAQTQGFLGLDSHPWKFRHWFWDVYSWDSRRGKWQLGSDSKRVLAYYPQSIGFGALSDAAIRSAARISHCYFGKTPIRALIHDSILCEVEEQYAEHTRRVLREEMTRPILGLPCPPEWGRGSHLSIGVAIKQGRVWADMEEMEPDLGTAQDTAVRLWEEEDEDAA